jgi:uroporphyrinogen III methyltransferase/synthase
MRRLAGRRVLLTRSAEDCAEWAAQLTALGAAPVVLPCIEAEILDTPELRAQLAQTVPRADWLVLTSRRGVEAFATLHPGSIGNARVATVGPATAEAARTTLGRNDLTGAGGTAESLAATLIESGVLQGRPQVLLALAANADDRLADALQRHAHCTRFDVYRTIPARPRRLKRPLSSLGADNVLLASPSAVAGFMNQVDVDGPLNVFTIGPSTSAAARAHGLVVTGQARVPSLEGILESIV